MYLPGMACTLKNFCAQFNIVFLYGRGINKVFYKKKAMEGAKFSHSCIQKFQKFSSGEPFGGVMQGRFWKISHLSFEAFHFETLRIHMQHRISIVVCLFVCFSHELK